MTNRPDPVELLALAGAVAREAGALVAAGAREARTLVGTKSSPTDMVTEVDHASEELIVRRLLALRPGDGILGEEGSAREGTSGVRWVIDPLDGTTNFLYGIPAYAVSIAAELDGEAVAGAVFDAARGELFSAARGAGATLDGRPIRVSTLDDMARALAGTGFGYDAERRRRQAQVVLGVLPHIRDIRRGGSAALDLCAVACGRLDMYWEYGLQPWDHAAGALIVREAGGCAGFGKAPPGLPAPMIAGPAVLYGALEALLAAEPGG